MFGLWETHSRAPHWYAGSYGNAALLVVVDSTIEVVHHAVVLDYIAFVGKHLIVGFAGPDEVVALPTLPVQEVA